MVDIKISDLTRRISPPPAGDLYVSAREDVTNEGTPASMVTLEHSSVSADANQAMAVGKLYVVTMGAWASDNIFSLPTTAAVGERIGIYIVDGDDTYKLQLRTTAASNDTIDGVDRDSSDHTSFFIAGESYVLECIVADTAWRTVIDGRISCVASYIGSQTGILDSTATAPDLSALTEEANIGVIADTTNDEFVARRTGMYEFGCTVYSDGFTFDAGEEMLIASQKDTGGGYVSYSPRVKGTAEASFEQIGVHNSLTISLDAGDKIRTLVVQSSGATQTVEIAVSIKELLP